MRRLKGIICKNRKRKIAAVGATLALISGSAFAYWFLTAAETGTGSGTATNGANNKPTVNLALHPSWPDGLMASSQGKGTIGTGQPLSLTADNPNSYATQVSQIAYQSVSSTNPGCETVLTNDGDGLVILWPDGTISGPGTSVYTSGGQTVVSHYSPASPIAIAANATGVNLLSGGSVTPSVYLSDTGNDDSACASQPLTITFTTSG